MLPIYILSKYNIRLTNGLLYQSLNFTMRLSSDSSLSSSSSDSSDSDSDNEKAKSKRKYDKSTSSATSDNKNSLQNYLNMIEKTASAKIVKNTMNTYSKEMVKEQKSTQVTSDLTTYLNKMITARKTQKTIDVALQPKSKNDKSSTGTHLSYEKKLINAAEDVANTIGGDKTKTTSDLLQKVLASRIEALKENQLKNTKLRKDKKWKEPSKSKGQDSEKKSIIRTLLDDYKQSSVKDKRVSKDKPVRNQQSVEDKQPPIENSISRQLLNSIKQSSENNIQKPHARNIRIWNGKPTQIFEQMVIPTTNIPELKTWKALEQRELKALTIYPPANVFQEMILWTEQGKLWKFPIDNEQGMEEEHNVHFADHVFMERHLKGWCPKSGPISHFMELVCTGLSKNPYLTVQEKVDHIMWYKDYFASKQDLLKELGAIGDSFSDKVKEITE
ncbi:small ribosomal subunit protein mS31 isoform X2 [Linepithema humile]|uniref:small ribosomal subunit protein mS31 isoform X2 n=1 Tax=Linepithema humile TaxID=83485 RepID=UPI000623A891|nr:PREDICTED: 28S ribosomal protein S31, mitochondrial isoform X2 [Linepithema humile]